MPIDVDDARRLLIDGGQEFEARWLEVIALCSADPGARAALADLHPRAAELEAQERDGAGWVAQMLRVLHEARRCRRSRRADRHRRPDERHRGQLPAAHAADGRLPARSPARPPDPGAGRRQRSRRGPPGARRHRRGRLEPLHLL